MCSQSESGIRDVDYRMSGSYGCTLAKFDLGRTDVKNKEFTKKLIPFINIRMKVSYSVVNATQPVTMKNQPRFIKLSLLSSIRLYVRIITEIAYVSNIYKIYITSLYRLTNTYTNGLLSSKDE